MKTSVLKKIKNFTTQASLVKKAQLIVLAVAFTFAGFAQTYTTKADGDWSSPSTWTGGLVPSATIAAGKTVNIKNKVNFDLNSDLSVSGTLSIINDTLDFGSFGKNVVVNTGGLFYVSNSVVLQDIGSHKNNFTVNGGRVSFDNSDVYVSKAFVSTNGGTRSFVKSKIYVGNKYDISGTSSKPSIDSINNSFIEIALSENGDFSINNYGYLRVANASIKVNGNNSFSSDAGASISTLKGAANNFGFNLLKIGKDLQNDGPWVARIDAACIGGNIKGSQMAAIDFTRAQDCSTANIGDAPELIFKNPVLKSGKAKSEGAVYRFSSVISGVDAEIKLKKFSRKDIVMQDIDLPTLGWDKAFQPQFGLAGLVKPNQNWYIDFELRFYQAGTNKSVTLPKVDMTALDVDGDGLSISEYAVFQNPSNVVYSTVSYLVDQPAGVGGQTFVCPIDSISSTLIPCAICGGDGKGGLWNLTDCAVCNATGMLYSGCNHGFEETIGDVLQGPVENFNNIDTSATQVMATYQYTDVNFIAFRYGAKSGAVASNGAGIRLNSVWFRDFSLAPPSILPVKIQSFSAVLKSKDVSLTWTANEDNVSHYIIQRSTDGKNYSDIAMVFANNAPGASTYTYKDANVSSSTNIVFYRLQTVDNNSKEGGNYSQTRLIRLKAEEAMKLTTYPNPVIDQVKITLPATWQGKQVVLQLFNVNGTLLQSKQMSNASQTETLQVGNFTKGLYVVRATCNSEVAQQQVIKN